MTQTAKLFITGRSQGVRLPREYRFEGTEVPADFMSEADRAQGEQQRDLFDDLDA
jgi:hypothetical protein